MSKTQELSPAETFELAQLVRLAGGNAQDVVDILLKRFEEDQLSFDALKEALRATALLPDRKKR